MRGYDKIAEHTNVLLDLPFYEGTGILTRDQAKPHHQDVDLKNTPTWETITNGLGVLTFDGASEYLELDNAACADLDFMAGDFSIGAWIRWEVGGSDSKIIIGRYELDVGGWELYLYDDPNYYLTLRFHHAGGASVRTACYSGAWISSTWHFLGISRSGISALHYRNGELLETICSVGGVIDPETCAQDLVIGVRYTKDDNYYKGKLWRPRIWDRALDASEWLRIFNAERDWFGV